MFKIRFSHTTDDRYLSTRITYVADVPERERFSLLAFSLPLSNPSERLPLMLHQKNNWNFESTMFIELSFICLYPPIYLSRSQSPLFFLLPVFPLALRSSAVARTSHLPLRSPPKWIKANQSESSFWSSSGCNICQLYIQNINFNVLWIDCVSL